MAFRKILAASAAAAAVTVGAVLAPGEAGPTPFFLDPAFLTSSACGGDQGPGGARLAFLSAASAFAQAPQGGAGAARLSVATLDAVHHDIGAASAEAQRAFDEGLAYTFGFNHSEAVRAFQAAQTLDPACALCFWGEAYALGSNINAGMTPEAGVRARAALDQALALGAANPIQTALMDALAARYEPTPEGEINENAAAFADAMDAAARAYPESDLVAVLAAEANMTSQPWNYWEADGRTPIGRTARTVELLETVLARAPDYPPAIHLYIHITEASSDPFRAEAPADRLAALTPELGHLVHMPSHTYYRLGRWEKSRDHNIAAVEADAAFIAGGGASPLYRYGYYPHNIHFALTSALMGGDGETALAMAERLREALPADMATLAPWVTVIRAAPYYAAARFERPDVILSLPDPGADIVFEQAAWRYARGEALAAKGDAAAARAEADAIAALAGDAQIRALDAGFVAASDVLAIAEATLRSRAAAADGDLKSAVAHMEDAAARQMRMAYMEPPWWYYPAKQSLAALLLRDGQLDRAEQLFRESLIDSPNNAWAYYGLEQTYRAMGDRALARHARLQFDRAWLGGRNRPNLETL
ncbi:MAG: hypothetical protein ACFE0P_08080 [Oceanicaulis sp.]